VLPARPAAPAQALPGFQKDLTNKRRLRVPDSAYTAGPEPEAAELGLK
jgi:hypothetical protein